MASPRRGCIANAGERIRQLNKDGTPYTAQGRGRIMHWIALDVTPTRAYLRQKRPSRRAREDKLIRARWSWRRPLQRTA